MRAPVACRRMGSSKSWVVNFSPCRQPFPSLATYLGTSATGRWQSTHTAAVWWLARCQPSYYACMMWQFAQAAGSVVRYDRPSA